MKLVTFTVESGGISQACFEWTLDMDDPSRLGCHMELQQKEAFKHLLCILINETAVQKKEQPEDWCQELTGMPSTKNPVPKVR